MLTPAQSAVLRSTVNTMIGQVYSEDTVPLPSDTFTTTVPSGSTAEVYAWTGMLPKSDVWTGPRRHIEPATQTYTVANVAYTGPNIMVDRFTFDDDQYGVLFRMLPDQVRQVRRLKDYWMRDLLEASGFFGNPNGTQIGYDGLTNFNTAHPQDVYNPSAPTYSNDLVGNAGTVASPGGPFSVNAFKTAVEYFMTLKGEDGERLGIMATDVMVPLQLQTEAILLTRSTFFAPPQWGTITSQVGAADNPLLRFGLKPLVNHFLNSATKWYLQDNSKSVKAMMWQQREAPIYTQRTNENDSIVYDLHRMAWGVHGRGAPVWGYPFLMLRSG